MKEEKTYVFDIETNDLMRMYHKSHMIPSSMFDDVVEDWHDKQVHVGTAIVTKTPKESNNMMLLIY
jgi:hypothetical protein